MIKIFGNNLHNNPLPSVEIITNNDEARDYITNIIMQALYMNNIAVSNVKGLDENTNTIQRYCENRRNVNQFEL